MRGSTWCIVCGVLVLIGGGLASGQSMPTSQPAGLTRLSLLPEQTLQYELRESCSATYSLPDSPGKPFNSVALSTLILRGGDRLSGGASSVTATLATPRFETVTLSLRPGTSTAELPSGSEVLPGLTDLEIQREPRLGPLMLLRRLPLELSEAPAAWSVGTTWTQLGDARRPGGDQLGIELKVSIAELDNRQKTAKLNVEVNENLMNPAAHPWGPLHAQTLDYQATLRGTAVWDLARGQCASSSLTGSVTESRRAADGRVFNIEEKVELTLQRARDARPRAAEQAQPASRPAYDLPAPTSRPSAEAVGPAAEVMSGPPPVGKDGSPVLAKFGDIEITDKEITQRMIAVVRDQPLPTGEQRTRMQRNLVAQRLVELAFQTYAEDHPEAVSDAEIDAEFAKMERDLAREGGDFDTALLGVGQTRESLRRTAKMQLVRHKFEVQGKDRERAKTFYQQNQAGFDGTRVIIQHILLNVDPALGTKEEHGRACQLLTDARAAVLAGRLTFEQAVQQYDQKPTHDPITLTRYGKIDEAVAAAAFALQPGEMSRPLRAGPGWCLFKVVSREPGMPFSLEQALPLIYDHFRVSDFETMFQAQGERHPIRLFGEWHRMPGKP